MTGIPRHRSIGTLKCCSLCGLGTVVLMLFSCLAILSGLEAPQGAALDGASRSLEGSDRMIDSIENLLHDYITAHGRKAIVHDSAICSRRFVIVSYPNLKSLGNSIYSFLNGYLLAVVLNRTVVLSAPFESLHFRTPWSSKWMVTYSELSGRWRSQMCVPRNLEVHVLGDPTSTTPFTCCEENTFFNHDMMSLCLNHHQLYQLGELKAHLNTEAQDVVSRLIITDEYSLYGALLHSALAVQQPGRRVREALLRIPSYQSSKERVLLIGVHIRHYKVDNIPRDISQAVDSVRAILSDSDPQGERPCAVLLSANRPDSFNASIRWPLRCTITYIERNMVPEKDASRINEHGHWSNSDVEIDDVLLLSMADIFIGSNIFANSHSTFSMVIADLLAYRQRQGDKNIYWMIDIASSALGATAPRSSSAGRRISTCNETKDSCSISALGCSVHAKSMMKHNVLVKNGTIENRGQ